MKKYAQITLVLAAFFLLVLAKNIKGSDDEVKVVAKPQPSPTQTSSPSTPSDNTISISPTPTTVLSSKYKDGTYTGSVEDAFYGNIQVQAVISNGKITDVVPLQYPNDNRTSIFINTQALAILKDEALKAQSSQVDIVTGASDSSPAFSRSLENALKKAQI